MDVTTMSDEDLAAHAAEVLSEVLARQPHTGALDTVIDALTEDERDLLTDAVAAASGEPAPESAPASAAKAKAKK